MSAPSTLDLSPRPGAAPRAAMLRAQTVMELRLQGRNAEQVLLTMVIPLVLLVLGAKASGVVDLGPGRTIDIITPGILALAVLSTSFTSLAIATGFERRYGIIKRLGASPLPRWGLLFGKIGAVVIVEVIQLAVLSAVGFLLGWDPHGGVTAVIQMVGLLVLGTAAFGSLGLLIAGTLRAEATLALANLVYVLLLVGGGLLVPLSRYPESARHVLQLLPSGALGQGLRDTFAGHGPTAFSVVVLLTWTVCASLLVSRTFKWE
ncbi:ABC transporter permease [Aeromicrobium chenweiae]|uniref:Transport permease protein n=1 Tax=Aeromicrobium chenweiae TaxID=2079793 RepID=A0A2S0WLI4_9ACTN|nr:ABC transporter permease [Aeromicrobium chenweiae]AWB92208.1 ABC transporter [Aeromicrobium chenweiae]TGN31506.1 ABC transporter permease [Aeromicrobium chenweiae]